MTSRWLAPWLLLFVFALPFIASWILFFNPQWLPDRSANHGKLIQPAVAVGDIAFSRIDNKPFQLQTPAGKWVLLFISPACENGCRDMLWNMRQVRLALGRDRERVRRILLLSGPEPTEQTKPIRKSYPDMKVGIATPLQRRTLNKRLGRPEDSTLNGLYVVDPRGDLMMRYAPDTTPEDMLEDLQRLLKISEHW